MKDEPTIYSEETITLIKPIKVSHIFDEEKYEVISVYDKSGQKIIILREKNTINQAEMLKNMTEEIITKQINNILERIEKWAKENKLNISDFDSADLLKDSQRVEDAHKEIRIQNEAMNEVIKYIEKLKEINNSQD